MKYIAEREITGTCITEQIYNSMYPDRSFWNIFYLNTPYVCHYCEHNFKEGMYVGLGGMFGNCLSCFQMFYTKGSLDGSRLLYHANRAKYIHYEDGECEHHIQGGWNRQFMKDKYKFFNWEDE